MIMFYNVFKRYKKAIKRACVILAVVVLWLCSCVYVKRIHEAHIKNHLGNPFLVFVITL